MNKNKSLTQLYLKHLDSERVAEKILRKPYLLGRALVTANCRRRVERRRVVAEMFRAAKTRAY